MSVVCSVPLCWTSTTTKNCILSIWFLFISFLFIYFSWG